MGTAQEIFLMEMERVRRLINKEPEKFLLHDLRQPYDFKGALSILKNGKYVSPKTSVKQIRNLFYPVQRRRRIRWTGTAGEFVYFVDELLKRTEKKQRGKWQIALAHFIVFNVRGLEPEHDHITIRTVRPVRRDQHLIDAAKKMTLPEKRTKNAAT